MLTHANFKVPCHVCLQIDGHNNVIDVASDDDTSRSEKKRLKLDDNTLQVCTLSRYFYFHNFHVRFSMPDNYLRFIIFYPTFFMLEEGGGVDLV